MPRKSEYPDKVEPLVKNGKIAEWSAAERTEKDIAKACGVSEDTFKRYKDKYEDLRDALNGKTAERRELLDQAMDALKKLAFGHKETETKTKIKQVGDAKIRTVESTEKYFPPNAAALLKLIANCDPNWKNDDQTVVKLRQDRLDLDKKKHEDSMW